MTKNDYKRIAKILRYSIDNVAGNSAEDIMNVTIGNFYDYFGSSDSDFDGDKFSEEAGYCAKVPYPDIDINDKELLTDKLCQAKSLVQEIMDNYPEESVESGWLEEAIKLIGRSEIYIEDW